MMLTPWRPFFTWLPIARTVRPHFDTFGLPLEIKRIADGYQAQAPLAGFKPEELDVSFADGKLTISAKRSEEKESEEGTVVRREFSYGSVRRQLRLPEGVNADDISASFENGLLTVDVRNVNSGSVRIPIEGTKQPELAGANS